PRVGITFYPERLVAYANTGQKDNVARAAEENEIKRRTLLKSLVEQRGLRAQLRSGSLLTGQLYVAFDYYPNKPKAKVDLSQDEPELPVVPGTLVELEAKLGN